MPPRAIKSCITVCKDCEFRHIGCHSTCEPYLAQKAEQDRCRAKEQNGIRKEKNTQARKVLLRHVKKQTRS